MRYRYHFEGGKHLVKTRDDDGTWMESREYKDAAEAEAVVAAGEGSEHQSLSDVEKAMTGPKGKVDVIAKLKPDVATKAGVEATFKEADRKGSCDKKDWDVDPHDFTVIAGVGARTAERLKENGITTLRMLSRVSASRAEELGIRDEWIAEAKRLTSTD